MVPDERALRPDLLAECRAHFNEPMLGGFEVVRCVGYGEDEMDCYIIVKPAGDAPRRWLTMVGGYTWLSSLKDQREVISREGERWDDFIRLDHFLALNGCPRADDFSVFLERT